MKIRVWAGVAALCMVAGTVAAQAPKPVKLGVVGPFTGPSSDFGKPMLQGVQLAVEQFNAVGGYMGRPIELVIKDDQGKPDIGRQSAQELIKEGVLATLGYCNTGVALKSIDVFQDAKQPLIVTCATGTPVTNTYPPEKSYIFRTSVPDSLQAPFVVNDMVRRGWTKVAILADDTGYGKEGRKDVEAALATHKLTPVYATNFPLGSTSLVEPLRAARDAGAQVIISYTVGPENAVIANGRKELGWKVPQAGPWTLSFPFFVDGAKEAADGTLTVQTFIAEPTNERKASFLSNYTKMFKGKPAVPMAAAQAYDAAYLLMYSLLGIRDGQLNGPAIKNSLENLQKVYYGVVGTYDHPFSPQEKEAIIPSMLVMGKIQGGAITFAYPEDSKRNIFVQRKQR